jgi:cell fate (sporulation/competence/biofilm development) regulator YlbF (YheA/YmcA/DUF963 family)
MVASRQNRIKENYIMDKVLEKARELGMLIVESDEFKAFKAAEDMQLNDLDAQRLLMEYHDVSEDLAKKASADGVTKEEMEQYQAQLHAEFEKIIKNDNIKRYLETRESFTNMINQVNNIIAYFVNGKEKGGCSGHCSSCGGCH